MQQTIQRKTNQMVRPASIFRDYNTAYTWKQFEIHRLPKPHPVEGATTENMYDEQYVINILTEQAELNLKYGRVFANQL